MDENKFFDSALSPKSDIASTETPFLSIGENLTTFYLFGLFHSVFLFVLVKVATFTKI